MKSAIFTQFQILHTPGGLTIFGLDQSGRLWTRYTTVDGKDNIDWKLIPMPQRERPATAWERLLQAQDDLRDAGREVEVTVDGAQQGTKDAD